MSVADKAAGRAAIASYIERHGPDVSMVDLRSFMRSRTGIDCGGPTLALFLKSMGYRKEGYRPIDSCPGRLLFYVRAA